MTVVTCTGVRVTKKKTVEDSENGEGQRVKSVVGSEKGKSAGGRASGKLHGAVRAKTHKALKGGVA